MPYSYSTKPPASVATPSDTAPVFWQRVGLIAVVAFVLQIGYALFVPLGRAERLHATLPFLWLADFAFYQRRHVQPRWGVMAAAVIGLFLFVWQLIGWQAHALGGRVAWHEPLWWLLFLCSLGMLYSLLHKGLTWLFDLIPGVDKLLDTAPGWWLGQLRKAVAILIFAPYVFTACNVHRFKVADATNPQIAYGLHYEPVQFRAAEDNLSLSGWYIPCAKSDSVVLICHGIGANKGNFLNFVPFLHKAGFNVFIFDFRGHGDSGGHTISFGYYEARDVRGAVEYLRHRPEIKHILACAFSMGGSALLHAIPNLPAVQGFLVDSTFANMPSLVRQQMAFLPLGFNRLMPPLIDFYTRLELGIPVASIAPEQHIAEVSPRPLLIIHGLSDTLISPDQARRNFVAAKEPKELWLVPGANHIQAMNVDPGDYDNRVTQFLWRCVGRPAPVP